ncbi:single-stranded DNA-binding protein [Hydrogenobaculum acidophilum]
MINKVIIIGRLTRDPELRILPSGNKTVDLSLAYNRSYKANNEWREEAHYFDVKAYGVLADRLSTQVSKGYMVLVEGRLSQDRWTSQDGKNMSRVSIVAESVRIVAKPQSNQNKPMPEETSESFYNEEEVSGIEDIKADIEKSLEDDDDVPF